MIYVICGPTGSGKTNAAKALSDIFEAPIINADAFQIYKDMDIGTAKISKKDPYYKKHYLLDIKKPNETFSVKEYQTLFRQKIGDLQEKYQNIIVCGGTGLYIKASLYDYVFDEENEELESHEYDDLSNEELYSKLLSVDKEAANKIHMNNRKRIIRALNIASRGKTKSEIIDSQEHKLIYPHVRFLMINPNREELYENINQRVDKMFALGLVEEVKSLLNKYDLSLTAKAAIGYKEVIDYLNGQMSLDDCKELIKKRSRNYAKRQVTFFKNQFPIEYYSSNDELIAKMRGER
ncbi:MAG: tRNA (adenosine(37)-N6)-dimethylallyltransferase MiaA [Bacilli bacterium]|nr:tRNA (adenosine(37)-N6)-dimethylallyltransferase MiaA [Bacilli bacterium]